MIWLAYYVIAILALIVCVLLAYVEHLQRELRNADRKIARFEREHQEEIEYAHRAFRDFSPEDPATVLLFPRQEERVR